MEGWYLAWVIGLTVLAVIQLPITVLTLMGYIAVDGDHQEMKQSVDRLRRRYLDLSQNPW